MRTHQPEGRSGRLWRVLVSLATEPREPQNEPLGATEASIQSEKLVVEFDQSYTDFVEGFEHLPSESQLLSLQAVDTQLAAMVGAKDASLWTVRSWREDARWIEVRALAQKVVDEFGWPSGLV